MDDRIHRYLDGELPWKELGADERAEARRFERAVEELRRDGEASALLDVSADVMERVAAFEAETRAAVDEARVGAHESRDSVVQRISRWLFGRREVSLTLRPVYAVAALVMVAGAVALWADGGATAPTGSPVVAAERSGEATVYVRFELRAPDARSVKLAGSFSGWSADVDLKRLPDGRWAALVPLSPGVHDYAFKVDEERWTTDPFAPKVADGFGGFNSRLSLILADS